MHNALKTRRIQQRRRRLAFEQLEGRQLLATLNFTNPVGGAWNAPGNWDLGRVPVFDDIVIIDLPGNQVVTVGSGNFAALSVTSSEKIVLNSSLSVSTTINGSGTVELRGGSLSNATLAPETNVIGTSLGGTMTNVTVNGAIDLSQQVNANMRIYGGLVLNGTATLGDTAGSTYGRLLFGDSVASPGALTGSGMVVYGGHTANFIQNSSNLPGAAGSLTFGPNVSIRGKNGTIYNDWASGNIVNQGSISADVAGGTIILGGGGFSNTGTINVSAGTLNWTGNSTLVGLGTINRTGGTINLGGTLDLQGATWNLNAATGSWNLLGGTVKTGTITESNGSLLVMTSNGGVFNGITVNGPLDMSQVANAFVRIYGGLIHNGTMLLGNTSGSTYGRVLFGDTSIPAGSLTGASTVIFGNSVSNSIRNVSNVSGAANTLTIGASVVVRGHSGAITNDFANTGIINQGTISADVAGGSISIGVNATTSFVNSGTINVLNSSLNLNGSMTLVGLGTINRTGGTINLVGSLDLQGAIWNLNAATGSWNLLGGTVKNGTITESNGSLLVMTSNGGVFNEITVNGPLDMSQVANAFVRIYGGLVHNGTMLLGNTSGSTYGRVLFGDTSIPAGSLTGASTVIFGKSVSNSIRNVSNVSGAANALIIGASVVVRGHSGAITNDWENTGIINQGAISADVAGGSISIGVNATTSFINSGTINVLNSSLNLNGSMTLVGLGTINRTGGSINLVGSLDLQGATWNLNAATGSWNLLGGTVKNGTITESNGSLLVMTGNGGVFNGITLNGDLDMSRLGTSSLRVIGGLVLNGTAMLGNAAGTTAATLFFGDSSVASGSLTGNATVVFGGSNSFSYIQNSSGLAGATGTLTLGPNVSIRGKNGRVYNDWATGTILNQGTISADVAGGTFNIGGAGVSTFTNTGAMNMLNGANMVVPTSLTLTSSAMLNQAASSTLTLTGNLTSAATNPVVFRTQGTVVISGGSSGAPRLLEVMGQNVGTNSTGFLASNFSMGALNLDSNSFIKLIDLADNSAGATPESLYVNSVIIPVGSTIDLNGLQVYTRALQLGGTALNGTINVLPDSGPLTFGVPTPGAISIAGQLDEWTFFSRAGQQVTIVVNPGSVGTPAAVPPQVNWTRVELLDSANNVLATAFNSTVGVPVTLSNVLTATTGIYRIRINAPAGRLASTGNYIVTGWDSTPRVRDFEFNRTVAGAINTPYGQDLWNFVAPAGTQVQFDLSNTSTSGLTFTLAGPNGYTGFTDIPGDSNLQSLPFDGAYSLIVRGLTAAQGSYSFQMKRTNVVDVGIGGNYSGTLFGNGDARLFRVEVPANQVLTFKASDSTTTDRIEMYARFNTPPTREVFEYRHSIVGNAQQILVPSATQGIWYVLVYGANVPTSSAFTFTVDGATARINSVLPERAGNSLPLHMTIQGAGFANGTTIQLVAPNGTTTYAPTNFTIDSYSQITADFQQGLPAGTYSVRVTRSGNVQTLSGALQVTAGGQARLETQLIMPPALGRRTPAILYVEYANTGDLAMPAPLIILQSTDADDSDKPILSLDGTRVVQNLWTSINAVMPPNTSHSILMLGSGKQAGVLNPGERIRVPVSYIGLLLPWTADQLIEMELRYWTQDDTSTIDWASRRESLRPPTLNAEQWSAVYGNLIADIPTTGDYVRMLNQNAEYLGRLGQNVVSVDDLWNFEVQQAYGMSIVSTLDAATDAAMPTPGVSLDFSRHFANDIQTRYATGPLGQGWYTPWQTKLVAESGNKIIRIIGEGGSSRTFSRDGRNGSYFSGTGDSSTLVPVSGGAFELRAPSGTVTRFRLDGKIDFVRDVNNNQVTAGYNAAGRLVTLTHSSGAILSVAYTSVGLIGSVTDSAGRVTTYGYDATNTYLTTVTTADSKVTRYTYQSTGTAQVKHSMLSIERGGTTQFFTYDARGRLDTSFLTGNTQLVDYIYSDTGLISVADSSGTSSLYFDHHGLLAKVSDPLGFISTNEYDANFRLSKTVSPTGESQSFTWCSCGSMSSVTNEQGQTTQFAYDNPFKRMTSFTDARGQKTSYTYDANGNLLTTVYPNGSGERLSGYTANGLPQTSTNRRGQAMSYTYNSAGQVTRQTFADSTFITYAYDARGNLTTVTDGPEVTNYTYNFATDGDRLKRITYPNGRYLDYQYDAFGRRVRMTDQDNFQTRYEYDSAGRLYRLRDAADTLLVTYLYDASGRLSRTEKGNSTFTTYTYDAAGQLLSLKNWRNTTELNSKFDYTYDSRGRRVSMVTLDGTWTYGYDGTGQLIRAVFVSLNTTVIPNQDLSYMYDPAGNRIRTIENGATTEYVTNGLNQYTSVGGVAQTYDADGNLTFDGVNAYVYDQQSRLLRVTGPQGVTEYEYDVFGNRAAKVENGVRTEYLNDPSGNVQTIASFVGNSRVTYYYGNGLVGEVLSTFVTRFYEFDAVGSTSGITSQQGILANLYNYSPFGRTLFQTETVSSPFKFVGQFGVASDSDSLKYMRARYYSSNLGNFLVDDPIGLGGDATNFKSYVENDPVNAIDPIGHASWLATTLTVVYFGAQAVTGVPGPVGDAAKQLATAIEQPIKARRQGSEIRGKAQRPSLPRPATEVPRPVPSPIGTAATRVPPLWQRLGILAIPAGVFAFDYWLYANPEKLRSISDGILDGGELLYSFIAFAVGGTDPNEKQARTGYGSQAFVASNIAVPYRIDFENYASASAPAQVVTISDFLSTNFDWSSFRLTEVGFGDTVITFPANSQYYQTTRSMTYNGKTFDVFVELGLRAATGEVFALFQSLDPNTQLPPDVLTGFLPPEDNTGRGKGYVNYTVRPKANLATGTEIRNIALISFDGQQTVSTDQVDPLDPTKGIDLNKQARITIDAVAPTGQMSSLPAVSPTTFNVTWSATDDGGGSGVGAYDVYVSDNGAPLRLWQSSTASTSAAFVGLGGRQYQFLVYARDNAGNRQATPSAPVSTTTVNQAPNIPNREFTVAEHSALGTSVGTVTASDPDTWQSLTFSIISGNFGNALSINPTTGVITVANSKALDFETRPTFSLTVRVTDNGIPNKSSDASVTVNLTDIAEVLPAVEQVIINDGTNTRSQLTSLQLRFKTELDLAMLASAFTLTNIDTGIAVGAINLSAVYSGGNTLATLTFSGASTVARQGPGPLGNSLANGNYRLDIRAEFVRASSTDAAMAADYLFGGQNAAAENNDRFFRLLGDSNGDGVLNGIDLNAIIPSLFNPLGYRWDLDTNGDGVINGIDLNALIPTLFGPGRQ